MNYTNIPANLRDSGKFCLWRREERDGKPTKVPYSPLGGKASSNKEHTFSDFRKAASTLNRRADKYDGLGIGLFGDLVGIDIDHCVDEDGCLSPLAQDIVERLGSYAEFSPSGEGVHILCRAPELNFDKDLYYLKNPNNHVEVYAAGYTNRYLTLTGDALNAEEVNERGAEVEELLEKYMRRDQSPAEMKKYTSPAPDEREQTDASLLDDDDVLVRMLNPQNADHEKTSLLWNGDWSDSYDSQSNADQALCNKLAFYTQKDAAQMDRLFRQSGLMRDKWDERRGGFTYGELTIHRAIQDCTDVWSPGFRSTGEVEHSSGVERALEFLRSADALHNSRYSQDDIGSGYLLADYLRPFARPTPESKGWKVYDGKRWKTDIGAVAVAGAARDLSRALAVYSTDLHDNEMQQCLNWSSRWAKSNNRKTYLQEAASVYPVSESDFDTDRWLLNLENGTLDLRTRELRPHDPDDLITKLAPVVYDPSAECPRWESFVSEIMEPGDGEELGNGLGKEQAQEQKSKFLQRYLGYCLSGDTREESFLVMYGPTSRNGKSVCVEVIRSVLGDYSRTAQAETLMVSGRKDGRGPSEDVARLAGARMVSVAELPQGGKMDASVVKQLTGRDSVTARFLGQNSFEYVPQFKLLLHTNHLPQCSDLSVFDSGRVLVLPFSRHFEEWEQDKGLKDEFRKPENLSAVLNWLLQGLADYRDNGLNPPAAVRAAVASYRKDSDKIARFVEDALSECTEAEVRTSLVYDAYKVWCRCNGHMVESYQTFSRGLERAGLSTKKKRPKGSCEGPTNLLLGYELSMDYVA